MNFYFTFCMVNLISSPSDLFLFCFVHSVLNYRFKYVGGHAHKVQLIVKFKDQCLDEKKLKELKVIISNLRAKYEMSVMVKIKYYANH